MTNEDRFIASGEQGAELDRLDRIIIEALSRMPPAMLDDIDMETTERELSAADREALAALGTPEEFVRRARSSLAVRKRMEPDETLHAELDPTIAMTGSPFHGDRDMPDLEALKLRLHSVQEAEHVRCTSHYRKLKELGRGGQGIVYLTLCLEELSGEQALKVYSPEPYESVSAYHEDMQRLLGVASVVHRIHHDNLVDVLRFIDYHGIYVMVMQWIDGQDVRRLLDADLLDKLQRSVERKRWNDLRRIIYSTPGKGRVGLQPLFAVNIIEKCLRGLSALHEQGIVHGDIKPANIMVDCNGSIRLVDIGSAYPFGRLPDRRIWTPRYAPPEFLEHGQWTPQSDLASLGYVLIELLSGQPDLDGPDVGDQTTQPREPPEPHRDEVLLESKRSLPERLEALLPENVRCCDRLVRLCRKLIDPNPTKRFEDANMAMDGDKDSAWQFRAELHRGGLVVNEANAMKAWLTDVKQALAE